jgi:UDP:flavonoid glycosyltransferase YjiC (YdhE family)
VPARIVLAAAGSYGDLFPTLGLAIGLKHRGHEPVVATSPHYRDLVESEHLSFHPVRPDLNPFDASILARAMDPRHGSRVVVRDLVMPALRASYEDFEAIVSGADLVLSHPITFAAPLAAERHGVPWLSTVLAPLSFFSRHDFPAVPPMTGLTRVARLGPWAAGALLALSRAATRSWTAPVDALRRDLGLALSGHPLFEGQFSSRGTLALFSSVLGRPQPDWPARTTVTGFVFYDQPGRLPIELARFLDAGDPPIVFTLGSTAVGARGSEAFYADSVAAALALGRRAVLLVGPGTTARRRAPLPGTVIAVDYAPHRELFPLAAVIVHHGGAGTNGQALWAGRPALVVPHAHDQPDNALRATRIGAARSIDARRYSARRAATELDRLLNGPRYATAAAEVGRRVRAEDGVRTACEAIDVALDVARRDAMRPPVH